MKAEASEKLTRYLLSVVCITAYIFLCVAVIASALNANLHDFVLGYSA